jgi:CAAX protease family protein
VNLGWSNRILGGFRDPPPAPLGSPRHLRRLIYIQIGIALALLVQARQSPSTPSGSRIPLYLGLIAVEFALAWFVAIGVRAHGHRVIDVAGRRWRKATDAIFDLLCALGIVPLLGFLGALLFELFGPWVTTTGFLLPKSWVESLVWIAVSIAAGICEETVYRGYLQRQLWSFTKSLPAAILLQAVIFGTGHIYQGWKPAVVTAFYGLVFGLLAAWRRSVVPGVIAHSVVDVIGGLFRP